MEPPSSLAREEGLAATGTACGPRMPRRRGCLTTFSYEATTPGSAPRGNLARTLGTDLHGSYVAHGGAVAVAILGAPEAALVEGRAGLVVGRVYDRAAGLGHVDLGQWIVVVGDGRQERLGEFPVAALVQAARVVVAEVGSRRSPSYVGAAVSSTTYRRSYLRCGLFYRVGTAPLLKQRKLLVKSYRQRAFASRLFGAGIRLHIPGLSGRK